MNISFENETKRKSFIVSKVIISNEPPIYYNINNKESIDKGDKLTYSMGNIRISSKVEDIAKLEGKLYFSMGNNMTFKNEFIKLSRHRK